MRIELLVAFCRSRHLTCAKHSNLGMHLNQLLGERVLMKATALGEGIASSVGGTQRTVHLFQFLHLAFYKKTRRIANSLTHSFHLAYFRPNHTPTYNPTSYYVQQYERLIIHCWILFLKYLGFIVLIDLLKFHR